MRWRRAIVCSDLDEYEIYEMLNGASIGVANDMLRFRGKEVTISRVIDSGYRISDDGNAWWWVDEMFEGIIVSDEDLGEIDTPEEATLDLLLGGD